MPNPSKLLAPTNFRIAIIDAIEKFHLKRPITDDTNLGQELANVYFWSVVSDIAADKEKEAWVSLVREKLIPTDDDLRASISGETLAVKSRRFGIKVRVDPPRSRFDKEAFIKAVADKFKIAKHKLDEIAKASTSETRAPLTKRVIEI